jgi:hypothetical protein
MGGSVIGVGGGVGGVITTAGSGGSGGGETCAVASADATLTREPVDIIVTLDNSGSKEDELVAVEENINTHFAQILEGSGIDYRVILLSRHRVEARDVSEAASTSICVTAPLSALATCPLVEVECDSDSPPDCIEGPQLSDHFFQFSTKIESTNSFDLILDTFSANGVSDKYANAPNGWQDWVRPTAKKVFLEMTDDNAEMDVTTFLTALTALRQTGNPDPLFGTGPTDLSFIWHSIIGIIENDPVTAPWLPTDPIQPATAICTGNGDTVENSGTSYQELSVQTGGLRFPLCQFTHYDVVFRTIAEDVVVQADIACDFEIPPPPADEDLILDNVAVKQILGNGGDGLQFRQAATVADCQADAFYIDATAGRINLCPEACTAVKNDPTSRVEVLFTCESTIIVE